MIKQRSNVRTFERSNVQSGTGLTAGRVFAVGDAHQTVIGHGSQVAVERSNVRTFERFERLNVRTFERSNIRAA